VAVLTRWQQLSAVDTATTAASAGDSDMDNSGAPRRGRKVLLASSGRHNTKTPSAPPLKSRAPSGDQQRQPTACACQWIVEREMEGGREGAWVEPPAGGCARKEAGERPTHSRMRPLTSPPATRVSRGSSASTVSGRVWRSRRGCGGVLTAVLDCGRVRQDTSHTLAACFSNVANRLPGALRERVPAEALLPRLRGE
jgi:hypothetical protein